MNIKHSKSGDNVTEINCPKCDHLQVSSDECVNCGVIIKKYIKPSGSFFRNVYRIKPSYILFFDLLMIGSFLLGGFLFLTRNYWPGGIEFTYFVIIISFVWGIVFLNVSLSDRKYRILLTDKGLKISKQPFIRWESIYRANWHSASYKLSEHSIFPIDSSWVDFFYYNAKEKRAYRVIIPPKINYILGLYSEIKKRMHASDEYVYERKINNRGIVEFGIWSIVFLSGFVYLVLIEQFKEFESVFISNFISNYSLHAIVAVVLFLVLGGLLALRSRE